MDFYKVSLIKQNFEVIFGVALELIRFFLHPKKKKTRGVNPNCEEEDQRPSAGREGEEEEEKALPCVSELSHAHQCKLKEGERRDISGQERTLFGTN